MTPAPAGLLLAGLFLAVFPGFSPAAPVTSGKATPQPSAAVAPAAPAPFARVYLALRGCTSCSHCRSTIRKMVRSQSGKEGETRVDGDRVEVVYNKPGAVPLREVIRGLADNRLHDLSLVDVLFEADGSFQTNPGGTTRFTLRETKQSFPVAVDRAVSRPADGKPVRLVALVEGWQGKGEVSLVAREVRGG